MVTGERDSFGPSALDGCEYAACADETVSYRPLDVVSPVPACACDRWPFEVNVKHPGGAGGALTEGRGPSYPTENRLVCCGQEGRGEGGGVVAASAGANEHLNDRQS